MSVPATAMKVVSTSSTPLVDHACSNNNKDWDRCQTTRLRDSRQLGPRRPSGWVLVKAGGRGPGRGGVVHAVDCEEAPAGAPVLPLPRALYAAEHPGIRLCSLCGAAAELDPVLKGFDRGFGEQ
ncbi:hypothetical protein EES42_31510 [Streptomyces sp. ADI95-17]|nr:hypothetical protein EES42_31510 [Streptomyces sp. ADI95-17]